MSDALESSPRLYQLLGIADFSSMEEVRSGYKQMALRYHPDKNIGDPSVVDTFRQVRVAYEVLGNTERKKKYDANLRLQKTLGTGARGRDYNPYMPTGPSGNFNASIYEEMRRQQEGKRATSTGRPGKTTTTTSNSYSKEQQELFRKKERERQAQLKKQREEEKRLQRERERESLRREQTRQEELLQRQWQQQQQRNLNTPRTARGRPARTGTPQPEDSPARAVDHTPDRVRVATPGRSGTPRQTSVGPRRVPSQKPTHKETRPTSAQPMRRQNSITSATTTEDSNASSYSPRPNFSAYTTTNTSGNPVHRTARGVRVADSPLRTASTERGSQQRADSRERKSSLGSNSVNPMSSPRVTLQRGNRPIRPNSSPSPATTPPPLKSTNGMNLSSGDREMLEKRRLDKVEKEKEKQRQQRREEEARHAERMERIRRKQEKLRSQKEEQEAEALSPATKLMYVTLDETSEREQLIEKEELLARQRIERAFSQSIDAVLGQRVLGTLTREEERYRTLLQTQMQNSRDILFCLFREGLERRVVELHELQGRKSLASASATSTYYARRRASRFLQLHSSEEDGRRLVVMSERAERDDLRVLQQESLSRLTVTNNEKLAQRSTTAEGKTPKAVPATAESAASTPGLSARVLSYLSTSRSASTTTPGATPLDAAAVMELRDTEEEERAVLMVEEERNFLSHVRQRANAIHMEYLSQREAAVRQATEEMQNELRSLREELRRARRTSGSLSSHRAVEAMNSYSPPSPSRLSPNFSD